MVYALRTFGGVRHALLRFMLHQNIRVRPGVRCGGVAEWLKAHAWKVCIRETVSRVRIPPPPPFNVSPTSIPAQGVAAAIASPPPKFPSFTLFQSPDVVMWRNVGCRG